MTDEESFTRAFVATIHALGGRDQRLAEGLPDFEAARALVGRLDAPEREQRATALAAELARVVAALDERRV